jgi:hypothetical protein
MEFMSNAERDSISNALLMNNNLAPPDPSASPFGIHSTGSPQLLDTSLQFHQNKPAGIECSHEEAQSLMISSNDAQEFRCRDVSAPMSTNFKLAEATPVTTTELRRPQSAGLGNSASLSVNSGGTAKVGKKRSRASRRAPTTLLNTDPSNFRAMVQRFTGIPETPFGYSSMNPTFSAHVSQQGWQLLGKPLPYKAVLDLSVSPLHSAPDSYCPPQYNSSTFIPFHSLHDYINNSGFKYPQGLDGVGLINSGSVFPTQL